MELLMNYCEPALDPSGTPIIVLKREAEDGDALVLYTYFHSWWMLVEKREGEEPNPKFFVHFVAEDLLPRFGCAVEKIVIDKADETEITGTPVRVRQLQYSASVTISGGGTSFTRNNLASTECIALAVCSNAPIFVAGDVFEKYKRPVRLHSADDPDSPEPQNSGSKNAPAPDPDWLKKLKEDLKEGS